MGRWVAALACLGLAVLGARSVPEVRVAEPGFIVEQVAAVSGDAVPQLEAVRHASYGEGVLAGVVEQGFLTLTLHSGAEVSELARVGPFNEGAELATIRFDTKGQFGNQLLVSVVHDGGSGRGHVVSDIYAIDAVGRARRLQSIGSPENPVALNLEVSDGSRGFRPGLYLQDRNVLGGSSLYVLDASLELSLIGENLLPKGRSDLDVRGMQFDPTGLYSSHLFLSDTDDHDRLSGLYLLDSRLRWTEVIPPEPTSSVAFGELAFSAGGAFDLALYVLERVGERIVRVSPSGGQEDFATGFRGIESIAISPDGEAMYVSDRHAIHRIRADATRASTGRCAEGTLGCS
jgi:hypothetical protein